MDLHRLNCIFFVRRLRQSFFCKPLLLFLLRFLSLLGFVPVRLLVHYDGRVLRFGRLHGKVFPSLFLLSCLFCSAFWDSLLLPTRMRESLWDAAAGLETIINHNLRLDLLCIKCTFLTRCPSGLDGCCRTFCVRRHRQNFLCKLLLLFLLGFLSLLGFVPARLLVHYDDPVLRFGLLRRNLFPFLCLLTCLFCSAFWNSLLLSIRMRESRGATAVRLATFLKHNGRMDLHRLNCIFFVQRLRQNIFCKLLLLFLIRFLRVLGFVPARLLVHYDDPVLRLGLLHGKVFPFLSIISYLFCSAFWNGLRLSTRMRESQGATAVSLATFLKHHGRMDLHRLNCIFFVRRLRQSFFCKPLLLFLLRFLSLLGFVPARLLVHYDGCVLRFGRLHGKVFPSLFLLSCLFCSAFWNSLLFPTRMRESLWDAAAGLETIINHNLRLDLICIKCTFLTRYPSGLDGCCRTFFVRGLRPNIFCKLLLLFLLRFLGLLGFVPARLLVHYYGPVLRFGLLHRIVFPFLPLISCLFFSATWNSLLLSTRMRGSLSAPVVGLETIINHNLRIDLLFMNCTFLTRYPSWLDGRCRTFFIRRLRQNICCKLLISFLLGLLVSLGFNSALLLVFARVPGYLTKFTNFTHLQWCAPM